MNHTNGTDRMRQLQLMALAENLYLLANRHRENGNYIVANALYGRALTTAQGVETAEYGENEKDLVARIQKDKHAGLELVRLGEIGSADHLLEKAK